MLLSKILELKTALTALGSKHVICQLESGWHGLFPWLWETYMYIHGQCAQFCVCTSLIPRAMTVVFGLSVNEIACACVQD